MFKCTALPSTFRHKRDIYCTAEQSPPPHSVLVGSMGRDSSVGIATRYVLDGPGIESRWGRDFPHPSRPELTPIQAPIQWVQGLSRG
jgi:hypothetical protein